MRRAVVLGVCLLACMSFGQTRVQIDGSPVDFDVAPQIRNGQLMVPIRNVLDKMRIVMQWIPDREVISLQRGGMKMEIMMNSRVARLNDEDVTMEEAPYIYKGRTMVPLRLIAQATKSMISYEGGWVKLQTPKK